VAGDYAIGSNHVLPTAGAARFRGGLNAADFVKLVSVQRVTERGLRALGADHHHPGARRRARGSRMRGDGSIRARQAGVAAEGRKPARPKTSRRKTAPRETVEQR
jgi:hypothetical protein